MQFLSFIVLSILVVFESFIEAATVKPYGFVAVDHYYDTHQVFGAREDFFLLWPRRRVPDIFGVDINDHGKWHLTATQTRIGLLIEQPLCWKDVTAKGVIEGDFLGSSELTLSCYRMRHAYAELKIKELTILAGQYWHPLFALDCFPDTISFNNGAPMEPQARNPQLRFTYKKTSYEVIAAAMTQRDFSSIGPIGASVEFIRNAVIPNLCLHFRWFPTTESVIGIAADYKRLVPRIVTDKNVATHETIDSVITEIYAALNKKKYQIRAKFVYSQNGNDQLLLSGFAVHTIDPVTDCRTYSNTQALAAWLDMAYWFDKEKKSIGLFVGGTKNIGSQDPLFIDPTTGEPIVFTLDPHVGSVFRIAPRFRYHIKPFHVGLELEVTQASYGKLNKRAQIVNSDSVTNVRLLFEVLFLF